MWASSHWLKWESPSHGFYTSPLRLRLDVIGCMCTFSLLTKQTKKPSSSQQVSIQTDILLFKSHMKVKIPKTLLWIWLYHNLNFCKPHIAYSLGLYSLSVPHFLGMQYLIFERRHNKETADLHWPLLRYDHQWKHTFMLACLGIEIVITVVREGNFTEDFRI